MNVSSTTALTRELKPLEAPFLLTDDPRILRPKYQILMYFEDWQKQVKQDQEYTKSQRNKKCLYNHKFVKCIKINVRTVIEQSYNVFNYE